MASEPIVAVEIGTSKVCALVGEAREDGHIMVTGIGHCSSCGVRKGVVMDLEKAGACVQTAIQGAEQSGQVEIGKVFLVISGEHIRSMTSQGSTPVMDVKAGVTQEDMAQVMDIARAVNLPHDRELVHSIPRKYMVDDQLVVSNPEGMRGAIELEVTAKDTEGRQARANFRLVLGEVPVADGDAAAQRQNSELGLAVDKEVADKLREKASESAKQPAVKAPQAGKPVPADKSAVRGAMSFSEQLVAAKATQDPLIGRIASAGSEEP